MDAWSPITQGPQQAGKKKKNAYRMKKTAQLVAANDHPGYFGSVVQPQFNSYGQDNPFGQFLSSTALARAEQMYTNRILQQKKLRFDTFLKEMGAGAATGTLGALGTGQAGQIDTGNPFTSSSGIGGNPGPALGTPLYTKPKGQKKGKDKKNKTYFNTVGTNFTDALRRQFLSLSPTERGETAQGKTMVPGRWSPWG